jgi:predicted metalloendopeptidase
MSEPRLKSVVVGLAVALLLAAASAALPGTPRDGDVDASIKPGDDFYRFANGRWLKSTAMPAGKSNYDTSAMSRELNARRVREMVEHMADTAPAGGDAEENVLAQKIGDYYASQLDVGGIEAKGLAPLSTDLAAISAITDRASLSYYLGRTLRLDDGTNAQTDGLFGVWIHQGFHDAEHYVPHLVQGGLGLADRDDYSDPAPEKAALRSAYKVHLAKVFSLAGFDNADARAAGVFDLETAIAKAHASIADTSDVFKTDNLWRRDEFASKAPGMDWAAYFRTARLDHQNDFVVWQPSAVTGTAKLIAERPIQVWKDYLVAHLIAHYAPVLPKGFSDDTTDRHELALANTTAALGEGIGRLYVAQYFPPEAKAAAVAMVANIRIAYRARLERLTWMSPETRAKALAKLAALVIGLGYPDKWTDYSSLVVTRDDALGNMRRAEAFAYRHELTKLAQPVDRGEWSQLLPQVVGAVIYFSPNTIQFSAGILQPPYFDWQGDAASNYGSAGAGLAHEVTHSFDELGNIYDANGRLGHWWTAEDLSRYRADTAPLIAQYDAYCPQAGLCVKGKQVLGESLNDLIGLRVAHDAYLLSLHGRPDVVRNGLTGEQRFFLSFARRWRKLQTDSALKQQIAGDIHAPPECRADTVRNMDAWYAAFHVKPGDKLYLRPGERVRN